ncbi:MAG: hypothetical protein EP332_09925 [Bacteroidetes bacterium]|nr:MAG: hypothetical protein EP332_09925 [Bacteroidota bacterium]
MINFQLKPIEETLPAGTPGNLSMSWFWLTYGDLWLKLGNETLYEYSPEAIAYFGNGKSRFNDYPIVRFIEDFTELFERISEPIPDDVYALTANLNQFRKDAQAWLELHESDDNAFYFQAFDPLISWTYNRTFDSGHLKGGPGFSFFRNKDSIRIVWNTEFQLENGIELWTSKNGSIEIPYSNFIASIQDFGRRFFYKMNEKVQLALEKNWNDIQIDKFRLSEEHSEREVDFWKQFNFLGSDQISHTNWDQIRALIQRMNRDLKASD